MNRGARLILTSLAVALFALLAVDTPAPAWPGSGWSSSGGGPTAPGGAAGGDLAGTYPNPTVQQLSGASGTVTIGSGVTTFQVAGTGPSGGVAATESFSGQAVNATNGGAGAWVFNVPAPTGSGAESTGLQVSRASTFVGSISPFVGSPTVYSALYLGPGITPSGTNYALASNGTNQTYMSAPSGGSLQLSVGGAGIVGLTSSAISLVQPTGGLSGTNAFSWCANTQALASTTPVTLANTVYNCPHLVFTGSITISTLVIQFPTTAGAFWDLDFSGVTFNSHTVQLQTGSNTWGTNITTGTNLAHITISNGKIYGNQAQAP